MRVRFERPNIPSLRKEYMLVDMHFHSRYSQDSSTSIAAIVDRARELGVLVALTDHNSIQGVLEAHKIAPGRVQPGVEITTKEGKDVLIYFPTVAGLEEFFTRVVKPYVKIKSSIGSGKIGIPIAHLLHELAKEDCLVVLAHPFAVGPRRSYRLFRGRSELLRRVHAFEAVNQAVPHKQNLAAIGWAMQHDMSLVGGSDGHVLSMLGSAVTAAKAKSWPEFLRQIKRKRVLVIGEERKMRSHVVNMTRILREKVRILENRNIRKGLG